MLKSTRRVVREVNKVRDRVDLDGTSRLSSYLRFGLLSIREVVRSAHRAIELADQPQKREAAQTWLNELIWRDFYGHIQVHFPLVHKENWNKLNTKDIDTFNKLNTTQNLYNSEIGCSFKRLKKLTGSNKILGMSLISFNIINFVFLFLNF